MALIPTLLQHLTCCSAFPLMSLLLAERESSAVVTSPLVQETVALLRRAVRNVGSVPPAEVSRECSSSWNKDQSN